MQLCACSAQLSNVGGGEGAGGLAGVVGDLAGVVGDLAGTGDLAVVRTGGLSSCDVVVEGSAVEALSEL
jgi:hypothetical protein